MRSSGQSARSSSAATWRYSRLTLGRAHAVEREAAVVRGVDQLVGRRRAPRRGCRASANGYVVLERRAARRRGSPARQTPWNPSQPAMKSHASSCSRRRGVKRTRGASPSRSCSAHVVDLEADGAAGRQARRDQVLDHLLLAVDRDRPAGELARSRCGAARRRSAARCRGARGPRGPSARRRRCRAAGRRCPARARRPGRAARRGRGCAPRARPTRCPAAASRCDSSSPAGPAPTMPTCVCSCTVTPSECEEGGLAGALQPDVEAQEPVVRGGDECRALPADSSPSTGSSSFAVASSGSRAVSRARSGARARRRPPEVRRLQAAIGIRHPPGLHGDELERAAATVPARASPARARHVVAPLRGRPATSSTRPSGHRMHPRRRAARPRSRSLPAGRAGPILEPDQLDDGGPSAGTAPPSASRRSSPRVSPWSGSPRRRLAAPPRTMSKR